MNQHLTRKDLLIEVLSVPTLVGAVSKDAGETMKSTRSTITVRYLGTAGWEIVDGATTILVDPYLSRIRGPVPPGALNYIEREIDGLRPDIVMAGAGTSRSEIYDYSARLMRILRDPEVVLPTHWDNFMVPYDASQQANITVLQSFVHEIKSASPRTKVIVPKYFETFQLA